MRVYAHTSAGLLVRSISKPWRGQNQRERNFPFISPSLLASFLSVSVSERHRPLLAGLKMQTAALRLSLWWEPDYLVCCPSFGTATVSVSYWGLLRGSVLCQMQQKHCNRGPYKWTSQTNTYLWKRKVWAPRKIFKGNSLNICLELWLCFREIKSYV